MRRKQTGHGRVMINGRRLPAAEWAYELWHDTPVPEGKQINHHCDNPPCVRPDHLYVGTQLENIADRDRRGRHANARKAVCPKCQGGYTIIGGKRHCIPCQRDYVREYMRQKRGSGDVRRGRPGKGPHRSEQIRKGWETRRANSGH